MTNCGSAVSIIIPAYNAAATIGETLRCVMAQTHRNLDIIVVDDGSDDATARIVAEHAGADGRIRLVSKNNGGVASARNLGVAKARSDILAFVDANDLWTSRKIERQIAALVRGGPSVGLVYGWSARIDGAGRIIDDSYRPVFEGNVLAQIVKGNFIGNGSCALVRRRAFEDAGGFEPGLRLAGFEGCEDILFYCRVAEHYEYAVVPAHLVGYRITTHNMSSNGPRMIGSWLLMVEEIRSRNPELAPLLRIGVGHFACWLLQRALATGRMDQISKILMILRRHDPFLAVKVATVDWPLQILRVAQRRALRPVGNSRTTTFISPPRYFMEEVELEQQRSV